MAPPTADVHAALGQGAIESRLVDRLDDSLDPSYSHKSLSCLFTRPADVALHAGRRQRYAGDRRSQSYPPPEVRFVPMSSYRAAAFAFAALCVSAVAACSSSTTSGSPQANTGTDAATSSTTNTSTKLSKADFVAQANALCGDVLGKLQALPQPTSAADYAALSAQIRGTLELGPRYLTQARALVKHAPDPDELTAKWISIDASDFATSEPLLRQMLAAASAKDSDKVQQLATELSAKAADHSSEVSYLKNYGLTDCAKLEDQ